MLALYDKMKQLERCLDNILSKFGFPRKYMFVPCLTAILTEHWMRLAIDCLTQLYYSLWNQEPSIQKRTFSRFY